MLDPGTDASVQALDLVEYRIRSITQVQLPALAGSHRNVPANCATLTTLFNALVAGRRTHPLLRREQRFGHVDAGQMNLRTKATHRRPV
ncbi:hypothetical protein P0D73_42335 [Paraburkholderia sp. RL18-101-BIB-B]|uniref:hypothetical protein n=1 Tax=unclassified Paraburkholderia TaxID=2615204 RepID=UPI0038B71BF1